MPASQAGPEQNSFVALFIPLLKRRVAPPGFCPSIRVILLLLFSSFFFFFFFFFFFIYFLREKEIRQHGWRCQETRQHLQVEGSR